MTTKSIYAKQKDDEGGRGGVAEPPRVSRRAVDLSQTATAVA